MTRRDCREFWGDVLDVGRDDGCNFIQEFTSEDLAFGGDPSALIVGESESLSSELFLEDAVLFAEVVD